MSTIIGIDPSLTRTGLARITVHDHGHLIETNVIASTGSKGDDLATRAERLASIHQQVAAYATAADLVVIEGPALNMSNPGTWDRAGVWWMVVDHLHAHEVPVAVCPPSTLKKLATGNGRAQKPDMRVAWLQRAGEDVADDNECDAAWLATAGALQLGHAVVQLPVHNLASLGKVAWPAGFESGVEVAR